MSWSKVPDLFKWEDVSWQHMLVKQPPLQMLILEEMCFRQSSNAH
jgi:hypothetical protein